ncbi:hypothetical protein [Parapedobacter sp.]
MKKQTITLALLLALCLPAWAQKQYKVAEPSGKLYLNLNGARIEGYAGNEIVFSNQGVPEEEDERAKGLQALSSSGFTDNTGLGISVTKKGNDIEVNPVGNSSRSDVLYIRVPQTVDIVFNNNKSVFADTLLIKDMKGEIEVSTSYNAIVLENNSGPMNIKNVYKNIEATFADDVKGPISIISVYGHVDVAMPASTKANLIMGTSYGKLYAAGDFNVAVKPKSADDERTEVKVSGEGVTVNVKGGDTVDVDEELAATLDSMPDIMIASPPSSGTGVSIATMFRGGMQENIEGTINGGGIDLILKSTYKNVYLRTN